MKRLFLLLFVFALLSATHAQQSCPQCTFSYFKNRKVSTSICYDSDHRFGKATAYNSKGEKIYERELRKVGGHSSVWFTYHQNGAVKKAEWRSAPDAGIQWYGNISVFSEEGALLSSTDNNYDDYRVLTPHRQMPAEEKINVLPADSTK